MQMMKYQGYSGSIEASLEDGCLHGKILFIDDLITYDGQTVPKVEKAFRLAVDQYLAFCEKQGKEPNKPYSGTFNVRIDPETHRQAAERALTTGQSLNQFVANALRSAVGSQQSEPEAVWRQVQSRTDQTFVGNTINTVEAAPDSEVSHG